MFLCPWGYSREEYWSGLPCPPPGDLPNPGIEPRSSTLQILYQLSHQESQRILEWVTYPFSRVSSQPRNQTWVSYIAGRFFTTELLGKPTLCLDCNIGVVYSFPIYLNQFHEDVYCSFGLLYPTLVQYGWQNQHEQLFLASLSKDRCNLYLYNYN